MTDKQLLAIRAKIQKEIKEFSEKKNKEWHPYVEKWEKANIPYQRNKVYELVENGRKRRGYKRFVINTFYANIMDGKLFYRCAGYWLDEDNVPAKYDTMTVYGVINAAIFTLSENQKHKPVPKHLKDRQ